MTKEDFGAGGCKICTRPFTVFRWKPDRTARTKRTNICLTCARLKNCCQCCMLDLSFGLPITVRDAALKMVAPGPQSSINREYYAQESSGQKEVGYGPVPGPVRTQDSRRGVTGQRGGRGGARSGRQFPGTAILPPQPKDILPPADPNITSLFVTGVEDDLPEHAIRTFFTPFGTIRSIICSHRAHCAFINYATRDGAEAAAEHCQGKAVIQGCPLRVQWGKPRSLDNMDREERMDLATQGRQTVAATKAAAGGQRAVTGSHGRPQTDVAEEEQSNSYVVAPPPGTGNVTYASLARD